MTSEVMCRCAYGYLFILYFSILQFKNNQYIKASYNKLITYFYILYILTVKGFLCYICWNFYMRWSLSQGCSFGDSFFFKRTQSIWTLSKTKAILNSANASTCSPVKGDKGWKVKMQLKQFDYYF